MGFCFFNSIAVACRLLQQRQGLRRILIVDWVCLVQYFNNKERLICILFNNVGCSPW